MASTLKKIGAFSEDGIKLAINIILTGDNNKIEFEGTVKKIEALLSTKTEKDSQRKRKMLPSAQVIFEKNILPKIREKLSDFEHQEETQHNGLQWKIDFSFMQDFSSMNLKELKEVHVKILHAERMVHNYGLLVAYHRGLLYLYIRSKIPENDEMNKCCHQELGVCYSNVLRYIQFALLIRRFPRLIVCGLSFSQFVKHHTRLIQYLQNDKEGLAERLANYLNLTAASKNIDINPNEEVVVPMVSLSSDPDGEFENYYYDPSHDDSVTLDAEFITWFQNASHNGQLTRILF